METLESQNIREFPRRRREKTKQYADFEMSMDKRKIKEEIKTEVLNRGKKENTNYSQNENTTPRTRKYPKRNRAPVKYFDDFDLSQEESQIKVEPNSEESNIVTDQEDSEDFTNIDTPEISEYEKLRLKNLEENRRMMIELGLLDPTKEKKLRLDAKPKPRIKKKPKEIEPRPRSLRLLGKTPEGSPSDIFKDSPNASPEVSPRQTRKTEDVLPMGEEGETVDFLDSLKSSLSQDSGTSSLTSTDNLINDLRNMKLVDVKKVTSSRVQSLCVHPTEKKLLTLVGSVHGELGLWDVNGMEVAQFEPHCRPINCITVCEYDQSKVFTTSHDGTVRRADLNKSVFDLIYQTGEEQDMCHLTWHSQLDDNTLMVAHGTGDVGFVDIRSKRPESWYQCHRRSIRTIHIHPTQPHYFLTASGIGECKIWDMRGMKKHCDTEAVSDLSILDTGKGLTSGFFSPDGNKVVTTCNDDRLRVYDTTDLSKPTVLRKILHDNHTGRWLSVFKAEFHPLCSDLILVGSMMQPRRIQMYNSAGVLLQELKDDAMTTITPVISVHPSLPVVVGGNSSGKAHLFTTQDVCDQQNLQLDYE